MSVIRHTILCSTLLAFDISGSVQAADLSSLQVSNPLAAPELSSASETEEGAASEIEFYGQINKGLLIYDDGQSTSQYHLIDNGNSSTQAGLWFRHQTSSSAEVGFNVEGEWTPYSTTYVSQLTDGEIDWHTALLRKFEVFIDLSNFNWIWLGQGKEAYAEVGPIGRFWFGQGSMASDGSAEIDLSGTGVVGYSAVADSAGGQLYRRDDGTLSSVSIGSTFNNLDGLGRKLRARYDSPSFNGLTLATSVGRQIVPNLEGDTVWDVALRYNAMIADYKIAAGVAYSDPGASSEGIASGSASVLHMLSGWSFTLATGFERQTDRNRRYGYAKIGHQIDYFDAGTTAYSVDIYLGEDISKAGSESRSLGGQLVQTFNEWQSEFYFGVRSYNYEDDISKYEDGFSILIGGRVKL